MTAYPIDQLRNVGLFSHGGAGKTSLSEAMLLRAGVITRLGRVEEGTTTSDYDPEAVRRRISVQLSLLPLPWRGYKVNVIDTPGYADFIGEVCSAMRVVDAAVILFEAVAGVEVGAERAWQFAREAEVPRLLVVNKMDRENADFYRTLEQIQQRFGKQAVAIQVPIGAQDQFDGVIDLITMKAHHGAEGTAGPIPAEVQRQADQLRERLIEAVAETDDGLINKYLEGEEITEDEVRAALKKAVLAGTLMPVVACAALADRGIAQVLDAIVDHLPSPADRGAVSATNQLTQDSETLRPTVDAPTAALVLKTTADPYVGRLTYFRVFSGAIHSDSHVWNASKNREERLGQLFQVRGRGQEPVGQVTVGDIGAVAKLQETTTGDTLCSRDHPVLLPGIRFPEAVFRAAVFPRSKADLDKLGSALGRLVEEDPTITVVKEPDTSELLISAMGESHAEIVAERLRRKFGVDVELKTPRVPYKETVLAPAKAEYKHKKQTGGHGQYGHVFLELEPLPRGTGFEFAERVVGGVVPKNFIPAVEKGVREALAEGTLAGYPVVDVKVTLYDGSYHPVDSSEMSFKIAAAQAFKKGIDQGRPVLIEPMVDVTITVPEQYVGDVMGDMNSRRARVSGMNPADGLNTIQAQAPLAEMQRYATDLRSLTQGRGTFHVEFSHYEEVPAHIAQAVIAAAKKEREQP
ncbi:MAG: elongation factor G [Chloroflexi bacterium]|nr:elongation factor G [Chloroflexota bacterium]